MRRPSGRSSLYPARRRALNSARAFCSRPRRRLTDGASRSTWPEAPIRSMSPASLPGTPKRHRQKGHWSVRYGYTGTWCLSFAVESKQRPGLIEIGRRLLAFREEINSPGCDRFLQKTADGAIQFKLGDTQFSDCMEQLRKRKMQVNADALRYQGSAGVLRLVQQSSAPLPSPVTLRVESWVPRQSEAPKTIREVDWINVLSTYRSTRRNYPSIFRLRRQTSSRQQD